MLLLLHNLNNLNLANNRAASGDTRKWLHRISHYVDRLLISIENSKYHEIIWCSIFNYLASKTSRKRDKSVAYFLSLYASLGGMLKTALRNTSMTCLPQALVINNSRPYAVAATSVKKNIQTTSVCHGLQSRLYCTWLQLYCKSIQPRNNANRFIIIKIIIFIMSFRMIVLCLCRCF